jgi:DNA mismatch repair protein MutS2
LKVKFEEETARLARQRRELEERQASLEREFEQERKTKLKELDLRLAETIKAYEKKWEQTITDLRAQAEAARLSKKAERKVSSLAQEVREEWNAQVLETLGVPPEAEEERVLDVVPKLGDRVRIADVSTPGTVVAALGEDRFEVAVGMLKFEVRPHQLKVLAGEADRARGRQAIATPAPSRRDARIGADAGESGIPAAEINVIGTTAEEARERLDKFLDEAFLEGRFRLRVIHGMGKGILRRTLHEMFASHPHVEKYYLAAPQEGGAGATIVELKM